MYSTLNLLNTLDKLGIIDLLAIDGYESLNKWPFTIYNGDKFHIVYGTHINFIKVWFKDSIQPVKYYG